MLDFFICFPNLRQKIGYRMILFYDSVLQKCENRKLIYNVKLNSF